MGFVVFLTVTTTATDARRTMMDNVAIVGNSGVGDGDADGITLEDDPVILELVVDGVLDVEEELLDDVTAVTVSAVSWWIMSLAVPPAAALSVSSAKMFSPAEPEPATLKVNVTTVPLPVKAEVD